MSHTWLEEGFLVGAAKPLLTPCETSGSRRAREMSTPCSFQLLPVGYPHGSSGGRRGAGGIDEDTEAWRG